MRSVVVVEQGARRVVVFPYFLLPGRHWEEDIPRLTAAAARHHPGVQYLVVAPLGIHPLMNQIILERINHCLRHAQGELPECDICLGTNGCLLKNSDEGAVD